MLMAKFINLHAFWVLMKIEKDFLIENIKLSEHETNFDCHKNSKIIYNELKKLGYAVKLVNGFYVNLPKSIRHSWLEYDNSILETDCKQLREIGDIMPDELCAVLPKEKFGHRYIKGSEKE